MLKKFKNKSILIVIVTITLSIVLGIWIFSSFRTYPLGDENEIRYLGKTTSGSWLPMSSMRPIDQYYYGTDLHPDEIATRLNAKVSTPSGDPRDFKFNLPSGESIDTQFYLNKNDNVASPPDWAKNTAKKYFFYILDQDYETFKQSLARQ